MKYIRLFFTTLGYITFIAGVGAAAFWYVGYKKNQKNLTSTVTFHDAATVSMTPKKETTPVLQEFEPISRPAASNKLVYPAARKKTRTKPAAPAKAAPAVKPAKKPLEYTTAKPIVYASPRKEAARPAATKPARKKHAAAVAAKTAAPPKPELPPCTLSFRATDNSANQRTGGRIDYNQTTELEKAAMRRVKAIQELEAAAYKIRHPQ